MFRKLVLTCCLLVGLLVGTGGVLAQDGAATSIIFMHHSTGQNLLEEGGVREAFTALGYDFWDHDYNGYGLRDPGGDYTGIDWQVPDDNTDIDGWGTVFAQPFTDPPANTLSHMLSHDVIIFKSCFPNSDIYDEDQLDFYRETFLAIRDVIDQHPDKLFIAWTTPPLVPNETSPEAAARARRWAEYLTSDDYLAGHPNLVVFDAFNLWADDDGYLRAEYRGDEWDSHPNALANGTVGPIFVAFVDEAIRGFTPGEPLIQPQPATDEDMVQVNAEDSTSPAPQPLLVSSGAIDDFEGEDIAASWWDYVDEGGTFSCELSGPGCRSHYALTVRFDLPAEVYGGCGRDFEAVQDWTEADGVIFNWQADTPGVSLRFVFFVADPAHPDEDPTPFEAVLETPGSEWESMIVTWDDLNKAEWVGDAGVAEFDPAQIVGLGFDVGDWESAISARVMVDDLDFFVAE